MQGNCSLIIIMLALIYPLSIFKLPITRVMIYQLIQSSLISSLTVLERHSKEKKKRMLMNEEDE